MRKRTELELVVNLLDALAAQLGKLKEDRACRDELIAQIIRLGALYQAIRSGDDLSLQAR